MPREQAAGVDVRELVGRNPGLAEEVRGVLVPERALQRYVADVDALLLALNAGELEASVEPLLSAVREHVRVLHERTVRLTPQHVYDLARRSPGLPAPFDLWAPLVESGLRLQDERDRLTGEVDRLVDDIAGLLAERDRARDAAVSLEQELARVDELIAAARFDYPVPGTPAAAAWRELVLRVLPASDGAS